MITIDFKEFAWNYAAEISSIACDNLYEALKHEGDNQVELSVLDMQAREAWCEVEDILEEIHFKEEARKEAWQERIQREDLEDPYANCRCEACVNYEEIY